jgi:hypothetical protein
MITQHDYKRLLQRQDAGKLTIFIDTSGFRKVLLERLDPEQFSHGIGQPVEFRIRVLKAIWYADMLMPLLTSVLMVVAFGWWGIAGALVSFLSWAGYKLHASRGEQHILPMTLLCLASIGLALVLPLPGFLARICLISFGAMLFVDRLLYFLTAGFVFELINSNYEFFKMFYLQPRGGLIPLIWTSDSDTE